MLVTGGILYLVKYVSTWYSLQRVSSVSPNRWYFSGVLWLVVGFCGSKFSVLPHLQLLLSVWVWVLAGITVSPAIQRNISHEIWISTSRVATGFVKSTLGICRTPQHPEKLTIPPHSTAITVHPGTESENWKPTFSPYFRNFSSGFLLAEIIPYHLCVD